MFIFSTINDHCGKRKRLWERLRTYWDKLTRYTQGWNNLEKSSYVLGNLLGKLQFCAFLKHNAGVEDEGFPWDFSLGCQNVPAWWTCPKLDSRVVSQRTLWSWLDPHSVLICWNLFSSTAELRQLFWERRLQKWAVKWNTSPEGAPSTPLTTPRWRAGVGETNRSGKGNLFIARVWVRGARPGRWALRGLCLTRHPWEPAPRGYALWSCVSWWPV